MSHAIEAKSSFNLNFRPASYFKNVDPITLVVASILGENRRKDVQERLNSGDFNPLVWGEWITESKLDESTRDLIGKVHPSFMGGEYLAALEEDEIEIARIVCASVTQDVTSVRARRCGDRIKYRVANEHEGQFVTSRTWSPKPLTMRGLVSLINSSCEKGDSMANGLVYSILDWNLSATDDPESLRDFIAVTSSFYPELGAYFAVAIDEYLDSKTPAEEEEEAA